jgi:hypothetical protein
MQTAEDVMTGEKVSAVIAMYRRMFDELANVPAQKCSHDGTPDALAALSHCFAMLDEVDAFIREGRIEKAFRWLGFIQGCLWTSGVYSIEELKAHNMP